MQDIIFSIQSIFFLSLFTIVFGYVMDFTVCRDSLEYYCKNNLDLYIKGIVSSLVNLLIVSPINYLIITIISKPTILFCSGLQILNLFMILVTHNILYFIFHFMVHKISFLRFIHEFHHKFKRNLPSIANSVSIYEFQFMYVTPFLVGFYLFQPNLYTFNVSIFIISFLNIIIHCNELSNLKWSKLLVSPNDHKDHHLKFSTSYAAPLLNFDNILSTYIKIQRKIVRKYAE